jgi:hypothetical protein
MLGISEEQIVAPASIAARGQREQQESTSPAGNQMERKMLQ